MDWEWQYKNRITDADQLAQVITLDDEEKRKITRCTGYFGMAVTPYFASLMDPDDPMCPVRMQAIPSIEETRVHPWEKKDPLNEERDTPVANVVHRYPDRVLLLVSRRCAVYCRHCIRKAHINEGDPFISRTDLEKAIDYIARTPQVRDVLISGGDPLIMCDARLEEIISRLRAIEHVEIIRIGTRVPAVLPMRITPALLAMLKKYHPIWINIQFNHPRELSDAAIGACTDIVDAGIPLGNQSVLLKNINDNSDTMKALLLGLLKSRVRPYYLYQCDLCEGAGHFRTNVETGIEIIRSLTGNITGFAIPRFVIDAPGGGGKIPISPEYVLSMDDEKIVMRNYKGDIYTYPG